VRDEGGERGQRGGRERSERGRERSERERGGGTIWLARNAQRHDTLADGHPVVDERVVDNGDKVSGREGQLLSSEDRATYRSKPRRRILRTSTVTSAWRRPWMKPAHSRAT
jgi:hypothetical protein